MSNIKNISNDNRIVSSTSLAKMVGLLSRQNNHSCPVSVLEEIMYGVDRFDKGNLYMLLHKAPTGKYATLFEAIQNIKCMTTDPEIEGGSAKPKCVLFVTEMLSLDWDGNPQPEQFVKTVTRYRPAMVNVEYLNKAFNELEQYGYDVVGLIQDNVKLCCPTTNKAPSTEELNDAIRNLQEFAVTKNIPILTAIQIPRDFVL